MELIMDAIRAVRTRRSEMNVPCLLYTSEPGGSQDAGNGETGQQPEPPAEGGASTGGTEGSEGMTVSELPDWLNPTGLEPAA